jgi:hypothetical protein
VIHVGSILIIDIFFQITQKKPKTSNIEITNKFCS